MLNEHFEQWTKNKNMFAPTSEWSKQVTELCHMCQHIAQKNLEIANESVFRWSDQLKRFSNIKKPEDFFNLQRECINENITACLQNMQTLLSSCTEAADECMKLYKPLYYDAASVFGAARDSSSTRGYEKSEKEKASSK